MPEGDEIVHGGIVKIEESIDQITRERGVSQVVIVTKHSIRVIDTSESSPSVKMHKIANIISTAQNRDSPLINFEKLVSECYNCFFMFRTL